MVQYRLPEPETDTPLQVTISPAPPPPEAAPAQTELQKQIAIARVQNSAVAVPGQLAQPHKIIAGWLTEHKRKAQEARYYGTNATSDLNRGSYISRKDSKVDPTGMGRRGQLCVAGMSRGGPAPQY